MNMYFFIKLVNKQLTALSKSENKVREHHLFISKSNQVITLSSKVKLKKNICLQTRINYCGYVDTKDDTISRRRPLHI